MSVATLVSLFVIVAFVGFLLLTAIKASKYVKMMSHSRMDLYPVPKEKDVNEHGGSYMEQLEWWNDKPRKIDRVTETLDIGKEMFLIKRLFTHQKSMWWPSFIFHWGIYILIGWSILLLICVPVHAAWFIIFTQIVSVVGFLCATLGACWLLIRRISDESLRVYTTPAEYFNLILILFVLVTGEALWFVIGIDPVSVARQVFSLGAIHLPPLMVVHFIALGFMLLYIPASKMGHYVGKFFAFRSVVWDNDPNLPGTKANEKFKKAAAQKPTTQWAAHMPEQESESEE